MPTVCASVPMQPPTTTSLRRSDLQHGVDLGGAAQRVFAFHDGDRVQVDHVGHRAVDDEEREVRADRVGVHDHGGVDAHLVGQLQRGAVRAGPVRHGQGQ
jgi:hypothetical protein